MREGHCKRFRSGEAVLGFAATERSPIREPGGLMSNEPVVEDAVAIVAVRDITTTLNFYAGVLGFEQRFLAEDHSFATVTRGQAAIHFTQTTDADALEGTAQNISLHVWVDGLDRLFAQLEPKLSLLPKERVRPPFDQPYGVREFHIKDPDGCLLLFAESR